MCITRVFWSMRNAATGSRDGINVSNYSTSSRNNQTDNYSVRVESSTLECCVLPLEVDVVVELKYYLQSSTLISHSSRHLFYINRITLDL